MIQFKKGRPAAPRPPVPLPDFRSRPIPTESGYQKPYYVSVAPPTPGPVTVPVIKIRDPPPSRSAWIRGISKVQQIFGA